MNQIQAKQILLTLLSRGGDFAEIYLQEDYSARATFDDGKVEDLVYGKEAGIGLRVVEGEKTYFANTNHLDYKSLLSLAKSLASGIGKSKKIKTIPPKTRRLSDKFKRRKLLERCPVKIDPTKIDINRKIALLHSADQAARDYDSRINQVSILYSDNISRITIANSEGIFDKETRVDSVLRVSCVAKDKEQIQSGLAVAAEKRGFELFHKEKPTKLAREAARLAILQLSAEPASAGIFPVVLSSQAGGVMIHEACGHGLEGDFVKRKLSVYAGKIGEKVASELVTVIDDGTLRNKRGSGKMDDEGNPTKRNVLIEKGILKGYLHDQKSAKENGVTPTGNGRRESYRFLPIPRMTNTFIAPGKDKPEEIIKSVKSGIFVKDMGGGQVDIVNGNFVFKVTEGYLIEGGKITKPVRGATLTGNGPEVLKSIDMVGDDLTYFSPGTCGKDNQGAPETSALPTIRIPKIVVGGIVK
ncbi:MAG: TldD/PmbA family protein [Candidatus Edwardsbacteria bacterium]